MKGPETGHTPMLIESLAGCNPATPALIEFLKSVTLHASALKTTALEVAVLWLTLAHLKLIVWPGATRATSPAPRLKKPAKQRKKRRSGKKAP